MIAVAAAVASAHSSANGAPSQDAVVGAMAIRLAAVRLASVVGTSAGGAAGAPSSQSGIGAEKAQSAKALARRMFLKLMLLIG